MSAREAFLSKVIKGFH